ncbi:hypothetical protein CTAYLR_009327 [Chrysophaeum taylorii]|uniref:carnosine N-methyltransferase n=1 Tax=Chrysophaeum taylorii TaxID=2483200 RepID=A0AAD7XNM4_9STRA|nr:hypothetical protein CTAYLR_009327 [Chrysophaeum taylorii]
MCRAEEEEERLHFERVVGSFLCYEEETLAEVERTRRAAARLDAQQVSLLPEGAMARKVAALREAAAANAKFLRCVVQNQGSFGPVEASSIPQSEDHPRALPRDADAAKVRATLHSCVRDWAAEGNVERDQSYAPLIAELRRLVPPTVDGVRSRVLVPGAGLARLALEIAAAGYASQGNEFSYHMLLVSNFLLNSDLDVGSISIHPYVDQPSNCRAAADRSRPVRIPDVRPSDLLAHAGDLPLDFSMAAGEFLEVYRDQTDAWDSVVTCFFLDTAPVPIDYVSAVYRLLKPGRPWINLGPLLYHWVPTSSADVDPANYDDRFAQSLELGWDELRYVVLRAGFKIVKEGWRECNYTANARSMMRTHYDCLFFTAVKPNE